MAATLAEVAAPCRRACRGRPRARARPRRAGRARDVRPRRDLRALPARSALRALGEPGGALALHHVSPARRSLPRARPGRVAVGPDAGDRGSPGVRRGARRAHRGAHERGRLAARQRGRARARHRGGERAVGRGHEDVHDGPGRDRGARARARGERPGGGPRGAPRTRSARPRRCPTSSSSRPRARCSRPRRRSASPAATPMRRRSRRRSSSRRSPGCGPRASARPTCATARARPRSACRRSSSTRAARSPAMSTDSSASLRLPARRVVSIGPGRAAAGRRGAVRGARPDRADRARAARRRAPGRAARPRSRPPAGPHEGHAHALSCYGRRLALARVRESRAREPGITIGVARTVLHLSPHPDDEVVGMPATLMALRDAGWRVVNLACGLGRPAQHQRRRAEVEEACRRAGFELLPCEPPLAALVRRRPRRLRGDARQAARRRAPGARSCARVRTVAARRAPRARGRGPCRLPRARGPPGPDAAALAVGRVGRSAVPDDDRALRSRAARGDQARDRGARLRAGATAPRPAGRGPRRPRRGRRRGARARLGPRGRPRGRARRAALRGHARAGRLAARVAEALRRRRADRLALEARRSAGGSRASPCTRACAAARELSARRCAARRGRSGTRA